MEFNSTTDDVKKYLDELKAYVFTISDVSNTGTDNLAILLTKLNNDLSEIKQRTEEERQFLLKRYTKISSILENLENSIEYEDNLDFRYNFYKKNSQNIVAFSGFMTLVNLQLDEVFKHTTQQGSELRREKQVLELTLQQCTSYLEYIEKLGPEIKLLIDKCKTV